MATFLDLPDDIIERIITSLVNNNEWVAIHLFIQTCRTVYGAFITCLSHWIKRQSLIKKCLYFTPRKDFVEILDQISTFKDYDALVYVLETGLIKESDVISTLNVFMKSPDWDELVLNLDKTEYTFLYTFDYITFAAEKDNLNLLKGLYEKHKLQSGKWNVVAKLAVQKGNIEILNWIHCTRGIDINSFNYADYAFACGKYDTAIWLYENVYKPINKCGFSPQCLWDVIYSKDIKIVKWFYKTIWKQFDLTQSKSYGYIIDEAIAMNCDSIIIYLQKKGFTPTKNGAIFHALKAGNLKRAKSFIKGVMKLAEMQYITIYLIIRILN